VLLYEVARCRNVKGVKISKESQKVFDQYEREGHDDAVKGGDGKRACLQTSYLSPLTVLGLVKTPCRDIIEELRALFHHLYLNDTSGDDVDSDVLLYAERLRESDPKVKEARERLHSSHWILDMINRHLTSKWDVDDDGSLDNALLRPNPSPSTNPNKRKAPGDDDKRVSKVAKGRSLPSESALSGGGSSSRSRRRRTKGFVSTTSPSASHTTYSSFASRGSNLNPGPS